MSIYRREWMCCGSVTLTEAWKPESCPFCVKAKEYSFIVAEGDRDDVFKILTPSGEYLALVRDRDEAVKLVQHLNRGA